MAVNDTMELSVQGTVTQTQHIHTLHFRVGDVGVGPDTLAAAWEAAAGAAYRALFHDTDLPVQLLHVQTVCGSVPLPANVDTAVVGTARNGTRAAASDHMPPFIAAQCSTRTALAGRSRQGRFFIGGLLEADSSYSTLDGAYLTLLNAYINALKAAFITPSLPSFPLVVHSRKLASVAGTACNVSSARMTNIIANLAPTTMRSRKLGHGL